MEEHERQHGARTGREHRGDDGQRVHQALIENAQHNEDGKQRGDDENRQRRQRLLISLSGSGKEPVDRCRHSQPFFHLGYFAGGIAERSASAHVEGDGNRREKTGMGHLQRRGIGVRLDDGKQGRHRVEPCSG